jgi:hypothetical protein
VHGLTGNRLSTWTKKGPNKGSDTIWPKTLLGNDIPNARILTLGYDADVVHWGVPASQNRVREHANDLNNALCDLRDATKTVSFETIWRREYYTYKWVNVDQSSHHIRRAQSWWNSH